MKATTNELASNVGTVDLNTIGSAAYDGQACAQGCGPGSGAESDEVGVADANQRYCEHVRSLLEGGVDGRRLKDTASVVGGTAGGAGGQQHQQPQQAVAVGIGPPRNLAGRAPSEGMEVMVGEDAGISPDERGYRRRQRLVWPPSSATVEG